MVSWREFDPDADFFIHSRLTCPSSSSLAAPRLAGTNAFEGRPTQSDAAVRLHAAGAAAVQWRRGLPRGAQ